MAVEAHHLLLQAGTGGQKLNHAGWAAGGGSGGISCEAPAASTVQASAPHAWYGREVAVAGRPMASQQGYQQPCMGMVAPASAAAAGPLMGPYGQVCSADASESGITFGGGGGGSQEVAPARKRKRAEHGGWQAPPVLGLAAADVAAHFQQQLVNVDRLVLHHTAKIWAELTEQRRQHARQVAAAVEAAAAERLRAKDEEISRIGRLNWALEERIKSLYVESQVWRDLAQSNEAAANALRAELQQALDVQAHRSVDGAAGAADDAESCCCGENDIVAGGAGEDEAETAAGGGMGRCKVCGEGAAEVLLLPCRHLCACAACGGAAKVCPACGCAKNGSFRVNFS